MASSSSYLNWLYDVFLSFRGEDVRVTFLSHFLKEFDRKLITAFKDYEIKKSRSLWPELVQAIRSSRIAVVVFSKNYASSSWCLNELLEIVNCKDKTIIPVFYGVDPSHVRKQAEGFGKIFEETCEKNTEEEKDQWKKMLTDVANMVGFDSANWKKSPPEGFEELVVKVARNACSLPLGLSVLGSHLRGRDKAYWEAMLPSLQNGQDDKIEKVLRISYDGLGSNEKAIFCHIASLFNHMEETTIKSLLADSNLSVNTALPNLADRSLIHVRQGYVVMHRSLQEMGRKIVRTQSIDKPEEREFLVDSKDVCYVLEHCIGTPKVLGISLDTSEIDDLHVHENAFKNMCNLCFLQIWSRGEVHLPESFNYLPPKLKFLWWLEYPMRFMPSNFCPKRLVKLIMKESKLEKLWEGVASLTCLKEINLWGSRNLKEIPDLSTATNLDNLWLSRYLLFFYISM